MIACDLDEIAENTVVECKKQWEQRKNTKKVNPKEPLLKQPNRLRGVPNSWCKLLKRHTAMCFKCPKKNGFQCSSWHMKNAHGIDVKDIEKIWTEDIIPLTQKKIKEVTKEGRTKTKIIPRAEIVAILNPLLEGQLDIFDKWYERERS